jgi:hypothetical protein
LKRTNIILTIIVFFLGTLLISYSIEALTINRAYSIPDNKGNYNNSTAGGEAFSDEYLVPVFYGPCPGALNVSLDTLIYLYETRPVQANLKISPDVKIILVKQEYVGVASRITTYYPSENLKPNTTYNVSGTIGELSVWWTFTTGSSITPQQDYEYLLSPYTWWIAIIAASIATTIFAKLIWNPSKHNKSA